MKTYRSVPEPRQEIESVICDGCGGEVVHGLEITRTLFSLDSHTHIANATKVYDFCFACGEQAFVFQMTEIKTGDIG